MNRHAMQATAPVCCTRIQPSPQLYFPLPSLPSPPPSSRERVVVDITDNTPAQHSSHHIWSLYKVRRNQQNCKCQCDSQADRQSCSPLSLCLSCYQLSTFILLYFTLDFFPRLLFFNAPASHSNVVDREDVKSSPL